MEQINVICAFVEKTSNDETGMKFDIFFKKWPWDKVKVLSMKKFNIAVKMAINTC